MHRKPLHEKIKSDLGDSDSELDDEDIFLEETIANFELTEAQIHLNPTAFSLFKGKSRSGRYESISLLGQGGMSSVHKVLDHKIGREVAIKRLDPKIDGVARLNFLLEAKVMSQLDHPGILPLYDVIYSNLKMAGEVVGYTMRIATHSSFYDYLLENPLIEVHKLCHILRQVALTLEHAHIRGVLHRDIKPQNILLGAEGEVYLTDWGVCTLLPSHPDYHLLNPQLKKALVGTPSYMPPEQSYVDHSLLSIRTDVYGLGASLYFALTTKPPYPGGKLSQVIERVKTGLFRAPHEIWEAKGEDFPYPQILEEICLKALSKDPNLRYQSAREFAEALEQFSTGALEQERLQESAEISFNLGLDHFEHFKYLLDVQRDFLTKVGQARSIYKRHRNDKNRLNLWRLEEELDELSSPQETCFSNAISAFQNTLRDWPDHEKAKRVLSQMYRLRYDDAVEKNDSAMMIFFEDRIREFSREIDLYEFDRPSEITFTEVPKGTQIQIFRTQLKRYNSPIVKHLELENFNDQTVYLKRGKYLIKFIHSEATLSCIPITCNLFTRLTLRPELPKRLSLPSNFAYTKAHIAVSKRPVTIAEYFEFLNDLPQNEADKHIPRYHQTPYAKRADSGRYEVPYIDAEGDEWQADWPVILVNYHDANAYAKWLSKRLSRTVRLPSAEEWLYAASGGDNRKYPWGMAFDSSLCVMRESHGGRPNPVKVGSRSSDCSPFGIYDVAGTCCQWSSSPVKGMNGHYRIMGAAFNSLELMCRLDQELLGDENETFSHVGFRVVLELKEADFISDDKF